MTDTNKCTPHNITHFIRNYSSDYYCEEHNTSYPTKKSLKEDHPNLHEHLVTIQVKRPSLTRQELQEKYENLCENSKKLHSEKLLENA